LTQNIPAVPNFVPLLKLQSETGLTIEMPEIYGAETGGSEILSYNLQFNMGGNSNNYISIVGEAPDNLQRTITKGGLTTDVDFKFRYRVRSKYGWSQGYSFILTSRTATIPSIV
jgi:hypothetical protein